MIQQNVCLPSSNVETAAALTFSIAVMDTKTVRILPMNWTVVITVSQNLCVNFATLQDIEIGLDAATVLC